MDKWSSWRLPPAFSYNALNMIPNTDYFGKKKVHLTTTTYILYTYIVYIIKKYDIYGTEN